VGKVCRRRAPAKGRLAGLLPYLEAKTIILDEEPSQISSQRSGGPREIHQGSPPLRGATIFEQTIDRSEPKS
jgi:hypothetical protein